MPGGEAVCSGITEALVSTSDVQSTGEWERVDLLVIKKKDLPDVARLRGCLGDRKVVTYSSQTAEALRACFQKTELMLGSESGCGKF